MFNLGKFNINKFYFLKSQILKILKLCKKVEINKFSKL